MKEQTKDGICNVAVGLLAFCGGRVTTWIVAAVFVAIGTRMIASREE